MIVIGYHMIGKSEICNGRYKYIDLDPKELQIVEKEDGCTIKSMPKGWEKIYARTAEMLSKQGYVVFISPDKLVIDSLMFSGEVIVFIYPSMIIREEFIRSRVKQDTDESIIKTLINSCQIVSNSMQSSALIRMNMFPTVIVSLEDLKFDLNTTINTIISNIDRDWKMKEGDKKCQ